MQGVLFEQSIAAALAKDFRPPKRPDEGYDLAHKNGDLILELKAGLQSIRDFQAAVVQLALAAPKGKEAALVFRLPKISKERIQKEWENLKAVLKPEIGRKLSIISLDPPLVLPSTPRLISIADRCRNAAAGKPEEKTGPAASKLSETFVEIFKVLLLHRFRSPEPISVKRLMEQSGASYTSVSQALQRLEGSHELKRLSNRSVQLPDFPAATWREILAALRSIRWTACFRDGAGRKTTPESLFEKFKASKSDVAGAGGVLAARSGDDWFDLLGTPRLDLSVVLPKGGRPLDAAALGGLGLEPCSAEDPRVILAIHPLKRPLPLFNRRSKGGAWWADEVETLLDLHELHLQPQAAQMIRRLEEARPDGPA